jgi:hypothetical protein
MDDKTQNNPAEIDLFYFFRPLGNLLKKIAMGILYFIKKILANKFLFVLIVLLISVGGFTLRYILQPAYQTEGIFVSSILPAKYCGLLLKNLNQLKGDENNPLLARQLKIPEDASGDIQSINMLPLRDTFSLDKRDTALSLFRIKIILKKMDNLDTIQWGLLNYLENNEYAIKRKDARRKALESLKMTLNKKVESLENLKQIVNNSIIPRSEGKGIILGEPVDPVSVYQAEMAYYKEQLNIDQALATIDNIEVVQPFLRINHYNYPSYNLYFLYFFLISLAVAGLTVLLFGRIPK